MVDLQSIDVMASLCGVSSVGDFLQGQLGSSVAGVVDASTSDLHGEQLEVQCDVQQTSGTDAHDGTAPDSHRHLVTTELLQASRQQLKRVCIPQSRRTRRLLEAKLLATQSWRRVAREQTPAVASEDGAPMTITAGFLDGTGMTLTVHSGTTGDAVRSELAQRLGVAEKRMKLIHGTGLLQGSQTVAECGLGNDGTLIVILMNPLSEGTMVYGMISEGYRGLHGDQQMSDEQVHEGISETLGRKLALHDAMASGWLLRKRD